MFETTKQTKNPAFYDLYRSTYLRTNEHPLDAPKARDGTPDLLAFTSPPRANFTKLPGEGGEMVDGRTWGDLAGF